MKGLDKTTSTAAAAAALWQLARSWSLNGREQEVIRLNELQKKGRWRVFGHNWGREWKEKLNPDNMDNARTVLVLGFELLMCKSSETDAMCICVCVVSNMSAGWRHDVTSTPVDWRKEKNGGELFRRRSALTSKEHVICMSVSLFRVSLPAYRGNFLIGEMTKTRATFWLWLSSLEVKTDDLHHVFPSLCVGGSLDWTKSYELKLSGYFGYSAYQHLFVSHSLSWDIKGCALFLFIYSTRMSLDYIILI